MSDQTTHLETDLDLPPGIEVSTSPSESLIHHHKEFERLLHLLHHEHTKLIHENKTLRNQASAALKPEATSMDDPGEPSPASGTHQVGSTDTLAPVASKLGRSHTGVTVGSNGTESNTLPRLPGLEEAEDASGKDGTGSQDVGNAKHVKGLVEKRMLSVQAKGHKTRAHFQFAGAEDWRKKLKWVRNNNFDYLVGATIMVNALYIGIETQVTLTMAKNEKADGEDGVIDKRMWLWGDAIFALVFVSELAMRIAAYQRKFFFGSQRWWNCFDVVTVLAGVTAVSVEFSGTPPNFYLNFIKLVRLARLVRSLKISKSRLFHNLRTLSYTVAGSANAFLSAIILLAVVMYVFGVMFMQGMQEYLRREDANPKIVTQLNEYFGNVVDTFFTLLKCITGGMDWQEVGVSLERIDISYQWFFGLYITFTVLCVLNILNGVFVSVAIESAQTNKDLAIETTHYKFMAITHQMMDWFIEADKDHSGKVSWDEMRNLLKDGNMRNFFMAHGIDVTSAAQIFRLLDEDGSGEISPDEFVNNLLSLQGQAKAIDLASLRKVCEDMAERVQAIEECLHPTRTVPVTPAATEPPLMGL